MLLLAIDTSGPSGGITLAEAGEDSFRIIESAPIAGGTFSAQLIPTVAALLSKHGFAAKDLAGFAAASGPGSFTGLRVGLSAIKGLAEVLHKPIAVVSVLEALAASSQRNGKVAAALDAGRKEIFLGLYNIVDDAMSLEREELIAQTNLPEKLHSAGYNSLVTSDPAIVQLASSSSINVQLAERPSSQAIARIGVGKLLSGETISVEALDANYLRRSDAEIFFKGPRGMGQFERTGPFPVSASSDSLANRVPLGRRSSRSDEFTSRRNKLDGIEKHQMDPFPQGHRVRVRPAAIGDLQRLLEIAAHSVTAAQWSQTEYHKLFAPETLQNRLALAVEEDAQVLGFIVGRQIDQEWEIENIAVTGAARRRGLGTRLLGEFMDRVRSRGGREIFLEVRESNLAARALYEKWAFIEAGRRKQYYDDPPEDALIFKFNFPYRHLIFY